MGNEHTHPPFEQHAVHDITYSELTKTLKPTDKAYRYYKQQYDKGREKYDKPVQKEAYTTEEWFNHLNEEITDARVYTELLQQCLLTNELKQLTSKERKIRQSLRTIKQQLTNVFNEVDRLEKLAEHEGKKVEMSHGN